MLFSFLDILQGRMNEENFHITCSYYRQMYLTLPVFFAPMTSQIILHIYYNWCAYLHYISKSHVMKNLYEVHTSIIAILESDKKSNYVKVISVQYRVTHPKN